MTGGDGVTWGGRSPATTGLAARDEGRGGLRDERGGGVARHGAHDAGARLRLLRGASTHGVLRELLPLAGWKRSCTRLLLLAALNSQRAALQWLSKNNWIHAQKLFDEMPRRHVCLGLTRVLCCWLTAALEHCKRRYRDLDPELPGK